MNVMIEDWSLRRGSVKSPRPNSPVCHGVGSPVGHTGTLLAHLWRSDAHADVMGQGGADTGMAYPIPRP